MTPKKSSPKKIAKKAIKETKRDVKQVSRTLKTLVKAVKRVSKQASKSTAKSASKKSAAKTKRARPTAVAQQPTKVVSRKAAGNKVSRIKAKSKGPKAGQSEYRLSTLANSKSKNLAKLAQAVEKRSDQIDALKNPNQLWGFGITDRYSVAPFASISGLMTFLGNSGGLAEGVAADPTLIDKILVITKGSAENTVEENVKDFEQEVMQRREEQRRVNNEIEREAKALFGAKTPEGRRKTKFNLLSDALGLVKNERAAREAQETRIQQLEKALSDLLKRTTSPKKKAKKSSSKKSNKKVSKKNATRKTATKKSSGKSTSSKGRATVSKPKKSSRVQPKKNKDNGARKVSRQTGKAVRKQATVRGQVKSRPKKGGR